MTKPKILREMRQASTGDEVVMWKGEFDGHPYKVAYMLAGRCKDKTLISATFNTLEEANAFFNKQVNRYMR